MGQYQHHVFVCTSGKTCPTQDSKDVFTAIRSAVVDAGIKGHVRVNHAGCLGQCGHGPMVVVYPGDVWYHAVKPSDAAQIVSEHLIAGRPVDALRYVAPPGDNKLPVAD
jgi:(2Fe-2S) ferredoxin